MTTKDQPTAKWPAPFSRTDLKNLVNNKWIKTSITIGAILGIVIVAGIIMNASARSVDAYKNLIKAVKRAV